MILMDYEHFIIWFRISSVWSFLWFLCTLRYAFFDCMCAREYATWNETIYSSTRYTYYVHLFDRSNRFNYYKLSKKPHHVNFQKKKKKKMCLHFYSFIKITKGRQPQFVDYCDHCSVIIFWFFFSLVGLLCRLFRLWRGFDRSSISLRVDCNRR